MATIYAHTNDGYVARFNQSSWSNARANTAGTNVSSTGTSLSNAVGAWKAGDLIAVKSNSDIETLGTADFGSIVGWNTTTDGSGGGDNESNVTKYSAEISTWSSSGYNDIALNSTALADIRDDDTLYICLINTDYDLRDIEPTGSSDNRCGMYYTNYTGTSRDPYVDYTLAPTATDNSVFFGTNF